MELYKINSYATCRTYRMNRMWIHFTLHRSYHLPAHGGLKKGHKYWYENGEYKREVY